MTARGKTSNRTAKAAPAATVTKPPTWEEMRPEVTDALLGDVTRRIVEQFHPHKVILFGSYVWGKPHIYSDLDLFVVMDSDERPAIRGANVHMAAFTPYVPMDVLVYTPDEMRERLEVGDSFVREILTNGRVLYDRGDGNGVGHESGG